MHRLELSERWVGVQVLLDLCILLYLTLENVRERSCAFLPGHLWCRPPHLHSVPTPVASMGLLSKIFPALGLLPVWLLLPGCPCQMLAPMSPAHLPELHLKQSPPTQLHVTCLSNALHDTTAGRACPAG